MLEGPCVPCWQPPGDFYSVNGTADDVPGIDLVLADDLQRLFLHVSMGSFSETEIFHFSAFLGPSADPRRFPCEELDARDPAHDDDENGTKGVLNCWPTKSNPVGVNMHLSLYLEEPSYDTLALAEDMGLYVPGDDTTAKPGPILLDVSQDTVSYPIRFHKDTLIADDRTAASLHHLRLAPKHLAISGQNFLSASRIQVDFVTADVGDNIINACEVDTP